ncbi:MAG TPA: hypothetical protein VJG32_19760 [Anaerolineae bacterium]|nr:hypothetical protein [Anaerolineae bacterium]
MPDDQLPTDLIVYTLPEPAAEPGDYDRVRGDTDQTRGWFGRPKPVTVSATKLQQQINVFLIQMGEALKETPAEVGGLQLDEIEVSAGITAGLEVALIGFGGAKGELTGGLRFTFKRSR